MKTKSNVPARARDCLEGVAGDDRDDVVEAGAAMLAFGSWARTGSYSMVVSVRRSRAGRGPIQIAL